MKYLLNIIRLSLIFIMLLNILKSQTPDELKRFMETYDKIKVDQQANEIVKKGIESEKDPEERPIKLLVKPGDITKYYNEKINVIRDELKSLNNLLDLSDSIPPLKSFGYSFFNARDSIPYIDNVNVTDDYILGFGDELIISVWGQVEQYERKFLERDGTIYIDNVGLIYLSGKSLNESKSIIYQRFAKVYSTLSQTPKISFLDVSVGKLKNINLTIAGHVKFPGNYVVNPSINILNLIILAGGIVETGTLRNIYLNRNESIIDTIDLYPFISGQGSINVLPIVNNDVLVIPSRNSTVSISGSVTNEASYEIKEDNIGSILRYAGGLKKNSNNKAFLFRKNKPNELIEEVNFNKVFLTRGDSLVFPHDNDKPKYLSISIENRDILEIPWINNMSYKNIFNFTGINIENIKKIELVRKKDQDHTVFILQNYEDGEFNFLPYDFISFQLFNTQNKINTVHIKGLIESPGTYPLASNLETLNSIITRSGGFLSSIGFPNVIVKRDTAKIGSVNGGLILSPGDTIIVSPFRGIVSISGEVHNPGQTEWKDNLKIKDYIKLSGGLTAYGDKRHIVYINPFGEAQKVKENSNGDILPGSKIIISQKPVSELNIKPDRFQQFSSLISSLVTIAILANSTSN